MGATENDKWKEKYLEQEKQLKILSEHCFKVIEKHEEVVKKFKENETQYEVVAARLEEREKQLLHVRKLLEPVYTEYASLKEKYEIEQECRHEAEKYASQITKENRVLKRQSAAFLDLHEGDVPIEEEKDLYQNYLETLNAKIKELEEEKSNQSAILNKVKEDYDIEREKHSVTKTENQKLKDELSQTKTSLDKYKDALQKVTSASEAACEEYENLRKEYDMANVCRNTAESFATEMYAQSEAIKRQSAVLISSAASDQRLMTALLEVENLTQEKEVQKKEYEDKLKSLEAELKELRDEDMISTLEMDNQTLHEEREQLTAQLMDIRNQYSDNQKQYQELEAQYKALEEKYELVLHPPPPPPPPLPPISALRPKGFLSRTQSKRTKKLAVSGAKSDENYNKAINEMMDRIKRGNQTLRPVLKPTNRRPSCPEGEKAAVEELHDMLTRMKRNRSMGDLLSVEDGESLPDSELKKTFQKIKKVSEKEN
ncbi:shootin-1 [Patella vulgata]|uniref:shootin-1 n=1 Tax=Patella vulgata TaxID=6465 RepID=UPI0021806682|nr:shootin-1 [Patella vulgata]